MSSLQITPIAHRGGALEAAENSPSAFSLAVDLGYEWIETDVHATIDGVVVVHHDENLDRTMDASGPISDYTWEQICQMRIKGSGERLMKLSEVLDTFPGTKFNIDAKADRVVEPLLDVIVKAGAQDRVRVAAFSSARLKRMRMLSGGSIQTVMSYSEVIRLKIAAVLGINPKTLGVPGPEQGVDAVQVPIKHSFVKIVDSRFIAAAHRVGLEVHVWTINTREEIEMLIDLGVDGIMTDYPKLLREVLQRRGLWIK